MTVPDWHELWIASGTDETFSEWQERQLSQVNDLTRPWYGWNDKHKPEPPPPFRYTGNPNDVCSICGVKAKDHTNTNAHNFVI